MNLTNYLRKRAVTGDATENSRKKRSEQAPGFWDTVSPQGPELLDTAGGARNRVSKQGQMTPNEPDPDTYTAEYEREAIQAEGTQTACKACGSLEGVRAWHYTNERVTGSPEGQRWDLCGECAAGLLAWRGYARYMTPCNVP